MKGDMQESIKTHYFPQTVETVDGLDGNVWKIMSLTTADWDYYEFSKMLKLFIELGAKEFELRYLQGIYREDIRMNIVNSLRVWKMLVENVLDEENRKHAFHEDRLKECSGWLVDLDGMTPQIVQTLTLWVRMRFRKHISSTFDLIEVYKNNKVSFRNLLLSTKCFGKTEDMERFLRNLERNGLRDDQFQAIQSKDVQ